MIRALGLLTVYLSFALFLHEGFSTAWWYYFAQAAAHGAGWIALTYMVDFEETFESE